jgi:CHAD domain-containing protein
MDCVASCAVSEASCAGRSSSKPLESEMATLRKVRADSSHWHVGKRDWSVVGCGLKSIYTKGRRALSDAADIGTPEAFHEWRKQVKYLRYQLEFLAPLWSGPLSELADQAHKLSDDLGDEHDLSVLHQKAQEHSAALSSDLYLVLALIDRCRAELRDKAVRRGRQLYEEKPREFASRLHGYWSNWQAANTAAL